MQKRFAVVIAILAIAGFGGYIDHARAQGNSQSSMSGGMDNDMAMMQKMMANRPKALKKADSTIQSEKAKLAKAGKYACCLKHSCDMCAVKMGGCPCGMNAASDKPVCRECKGGWYAGDGAIDGKTADQIKVMPQMDDSMMGHKM